MAQITARVSEEVTEALDVAAATLKRSSAEVIRQALESYLEDFDDLTVALERLRDPTDPVLDWDEVRRELLDSDLGAAPGGRSRSCPETPGNGLLTPSMRWENSRCPAAR